MQEISFAAENIFPRRVGRKGNCDQVVDWSKVCLTAFAQWGIGQGSTLAQGRVQAPASELQHSPYHQACWIYGWILPANTITIKLSRARECNRVRFGSFFWPTNKSVGRRSVLFQSFWISNWWRGDRNPHFWIYGLLDIFWRGLLLPKLIPSFDRGQYMFVLTSRDRLLIIGSLLAIYGRNHYGVSTHMDKYLGEYVTATWGKTGYLDCLKDVLRLVSKQVPSHHLGD